MIDNERDDRSNDGGAKTLAITRSVDVSCGALMDERGGQTQGPNGPERRKAIGGAVTPSIRTTTTGTTPR